jgi:FkbM family methyltransferase
MQDRILSWLLKQPEASLSPALDMCILVPMRITYLTLKCLLRLILRNEERIRRIRILHKVCVWLNGFFSPSIHAAKMTDKIIRKLRPSLQPFMIKLIVPRYGYRYYCKIIDFAPGREDDVIQYFNPAMGDVVVDIGAHVGRYTILGSKLVGRSGKVIAVEAHPGNFQLLKRNLQLNKSDNVITLNCAAYSQDKPQLRLLLAGEDQGNTIYNTVMEGRDVTEKFVTVPALKLDSIVQHAGIQAHEIDWIKIDVEGAEYEVLKGAQNILSNSKDISVLIEVHNLQNSNLYDPIIDMLAEHKFSIIYQKIYDSGERHIILSKFSNQNRYHSYRTTSDHFCD